MSKMFVEVEVYYVKDKNERIITIDGKELFRGTDRTYKKGEVMVKTPVYYYEEGLMAGLNATGINFSCSCGDETVADNKEFKDKMKNWKPKHNNDGGNI